MQYLKNSKPSIWWRELKKLSGLSPAVGSSDKVSKSLQQIYGISDQLHGLANIVNETFLSPMRSLTPLPSDYWCNSGKERTYLHAEICGRLKAQADGFQLNETKCKELRFNFSSHPAQFEPIIINNKKIEVVRSAKVLDMKISSDLKWNEHIQYICKKVASRLYLLRQLKRAQLPAKDLFLFYITCIRSIVEYQFIKLAESLKQLITGVFLCWSSCLKF